MPQDTDARDRRARLGQLIGPWTNVPALVYDRHLNVVVSNELAGIVQPTFRVGSNLARAAFLNEQLDHTLGDVAVKHAGSPQSCVKHSRHRARTLPTSDSSGSWRR